MLDHILASGSLDLASFERLARRLEDFFLTTSRRDLRGPAYLERMRAEQRENRQLLTRRRFALDHGRLSAVLDRMDGALSRNAALLASRAERGRLVDGHGDLRPEHICFSNSVDIIDCLEFNAELRLTDPVEEIAFLGLECELLGAADLGPALFARIRTARDDDAPQTLYHLHFARKGLLRTRLMLAHLLDPSSRLAEKWEPLAQRYLSLAETGLDRLDAQEPLSLQPVRAGSADARKADINDGR
jgi:aminoglycoside phosphotransferase family enzyme